MKYSSLFKTILFAAVTCFMSFCSHAEVSKNMTFEGTIGTYPILLTVNCSDGSCEGTYCYRKTRQDIGLEGKWLSGTTVQLTTKDEEETFKLSVAPGGGWSGTWKNKKGKQLAVMLKILDINKVAHAYKDLMFVQQLKKENPYAYARTADLVLTKDSVTQSMGHTLQWYHMERSGVYFFYITSGYTDAQLKKINAALLNAAVSAAEDHYSCVASGGTVDMDFGIERFYFSGGIVSVSQHESYFCGGAYPDETTIAVNIDVNTGRQLNLEDVLWFGAGNAPAPKEDSKEWFSYREKVFAPKVIDLLHKYHAADMDGRDTTDDNECVYDAQVYEFPAFYFTQEGLYLAPSFPHAQTPCRYPDWSILPYDEVKKHLRAGITL